MALLAQLQAQRQAVIRCQRRLVQAAAARAGSAVGYHTGLPAAERKALCAARAAIVKAIETDAPAPAGYERQTAAVRVFVSACLASRRPFDAMRRDTEAAMVAAAKRLPVWPWAQTVRGFGPLGLACIVGECGHLLLLPEGRSSVGKLWSRFGLAPAQHYAVTTKAGKVAIAKPKARRAVMWTIGDSLLKTNQDGYRSLYLDRLRHEYDAATAAGLRVVASGKAVVESWRKRGLPLPTVGKSKAGETRTVKHLTNRAQRYTEKRLLRDLWAAWRGSAG